MDEFIPKLRDLLASMEEKKWQLARELWKKVLELAPDNLEAQKHLENFNSLDATFQKGLHHYKDQQWQEAYECFEQVHENTKNYRGAYSRMATTRLKLEQMLGRKVVELEIAKKARGL